MPPVNAPIGMAARRGDEPLSPEQLLDTARRAEPPAHERLEGHHDPLGEARQVDEAANPPTREESHLPTRAELERARVVEVAHRLGVSTQIEHVDPIDGHE